ncbi:hypothetical protein FA13DRAFT_157619 [Coprinellus micaceus]|uniref:Uncharacterized protein n=1 Tax=Coprinellus micaceus TaxID=71717 RepID=A0A4Y7THQ8_COPMI|nr:hypothetical protein FA13DRAFT_157619 [Coprinellus micaceus]
MDAGSLHVNPPRARSATIRLPLYHLHLLPRPVEHRHELPQLLQANLIRILNASMHLACTGDALASHLAGIIAGNRITFRTLSSAASVLQFRDVVGAVFLWMRASDFPFHDHPSLAKGQFAIIFLLHSDPEYRCFALAKVLLSFLQDAKGQSPAFHFEVVSFAFRCPRTDKIVGIVILDEGFAPIYSHAVLSANGLTPQASPLKFRQVHIRDSNVPVSFSRACPVPVDDSLYESMLSMARDLYTT